MTRVLKLIFEVHGGKTVTFNVADPKSDLTKTEALTTANLILEADAIDYNGADATDLKDVYIYETNKVALS